MNFKQGDWVTWRTRVTNEWVSGKVIDLKADHVVVMMPAIKFPIHFTIEECRALGMQRRYFIEGNKWDM
jgi:hypothetical protein